MPHLRLLDEIAANATPAPVTRLVDGWLAKSGPEAPFRRARCVLPAFSGGADPARVDAVLDELEEWYGERGLPVLIQVSFGDATAEALDEHLAARGYEVEAPVVVESAATADVLARCMAGSRAEVHADVAVGVGLACDDLGEVLPADDVEGRRRVEGYGRMLGPLGVGALVAVGRLDGAPVGLGFGVVERGHLGVFGLRIAEPARREGVGTAVLGALVGAAVESDAGRTYVQVESDNAAGRAFFVGHGYTHSHRYHYRVSRPTPE